MIITKYLFTDFEFFFCHLRKVENIRKIPTLDGDVDSSNQKVCKNGYQSFLVPSTKYKHPYSDG